MMSELERDQDKDGEKPCVKHLCDEQARPEVTRAILDLGKSCSSPSRIEEGLCPLNLGCGIGMTCDRAAGTNLGSVTVRGLLWVQGKYKAPVTSLSDGPLWAQGPNSSQAEHTAKHTRTRAAMSLRRN